MATVVAICVDVTTNILRNVQLCNVHRQYTAPAKRNSKNWAGLCYRVVTESGFEIL